jgi:glutamate/tyrosine decarboxylase-like PLP-dependent enzyme
MVIFYCPRGCQTCDKRTAAVVGLECGACGSVMTRNSARYDAVHEAIEERQIAEAERKSKE